MRIKISGIKETYDRIGLLDKEIDKGVAIIAERIFERSIDGAESHRRTGALVRSLGTNPIRIKGGWQIKSRAEIAPYNAAVHFGVKPRVIKPRNKKALRFPMGGEFVFAKLVKHPGYKGDAFMFRARDVTYREIDDIFAGVLKNA